MSYDPNDDGRYEPPDDADRAMGENPYSAHHDVARRDAWDEGYEAALAAANEHADRLASALRRWCDCEEDRLRVEADERGLEGADAWTVLVGTGYTMLAAALASHEARRKGEASGATNRQPVKAGSADPLRAVAEKEERDG